MAELSQFTIERSAGVSGGSLPVAALEHGLFDTAPEQMSSESDSGDEFRACGIGIQTEILHLRSPTESIGVSDFPVFRASSRYCRRGREQEQKQRQLPAIYYWALISFCALASVVILSPDHSVHVFMSSENSMTPSLPTGHPLPFMKRTCLTGLALPKSIPIHDCASLPDAQFDHQEYKLSSKDLSQP